MNRGFLGRFRELLFVVAGGVVVGFVVDQFVGVVFNGDILDRLGGLLDEFLSAVEVFVLQRLDHLGGLHRFDHLGGLHRDGSREDRSPGRPVADRVDDEKQNPEPAGPDAHPGDQLVARHNGGHQGGQSDDRQDQGDDQHGSVTDQASRL